MVTYVTHFTCLTDKHTEGIIKATGKNLPEKPPSYGHICKRINKLNIDIKKRENVDDDNDNDDDDYIIIAIDSTGIKITNRGQWMDKKWNVQNRKKGYLKIHVAVNMKTKGIRALEVTDEKVHNNKILKHW